MSSSQSDPSLVASLLIAGIGNPVDGLSCRTAVDPLRKSAISCSMRAQHHPTGNSGSPSVTGAAGSTYFLPGCSASHFARRSARMRASRRSAGSSVGILGRQPALARGLEHRRPVAFQVGLHALERRDAHVQPGELLLDLGDDAALFGERGERDLADVRSNAIRQWPRKVVPAGLFSQLLLDVVAANRGSTGWIPFWPAGAKPPNLGLYMMSLAQIGCSNRCAN